MERRVHPGYIVIACPARETLTEQALTRNLPLVAYLYSGPHDGSWIQDTKRNNEYSYLYRFRRTLEGRCICLQ
jgi:hypothetical protein